jgi:thiamine-monophosphate kinase
MARQLHEVGEFELIAAVTAGLPELPPGWVGPGDDAAIVPVPDGRVVATTDVLVERQHFRRDWSSAADVGHKAAAQNLADIAAMGATPTALLVGFAAPADLDERWALDFQEALVAEAARGGAAVVGGDVVRSDQIVVSVTALGTLEGRTPVLRSGARAGDLLALSGPTGASAAGLAVLRRGFTAPRAAVAAHRRPTPDYAQGRIAAEAGAHAMIDVSDGLVADLRHVADASEVAIDIEPTLLEVPDTVTAVSAALGGSDPLTMVLTGGEDHVLAALFGARDDVPDGWRVVGLASAGSGVTVAGSPYDGDGGHRSF